MHMGSEETKINSVEEATKKEQLLTPEGIKARYSPYIAGNTVQEDRGFFW